MNDCKHGEIETDVSRGMIRCRKCGASARLGGASLDVPRLQRAIYAVDRGHYLDVDDASEFAADIAREYASSGLPVKVTGGKAR